MDTELAAGVVSLISQLRELQNKLTNPVTDQKTGIAVPRLPLETTQQLKSTVDGLRLCLWAYLDTYSGNRDVQQKLQQIRIDATADMLHLLERDFREGGIPRTTQTQRLCQQILAMSKVARGAAAG